MKRLAAALLPLFLTLGVLNFPASAAGPYKTRHVIVAVMDGVRYSETFGDPSHRYVPRMWRELVPQGVLYTNYYNRGVTVTRQGHSSIASGTWQSVPNGGPRLTMPTFFDYFREETGAPAEKAWAIFGKGAYSFAPYSSFPAYGDRWAPKTAIGIGEKSLEDDHKVLAKILEVMKTDRPSLIFANLGYTDHSGHVAPFEEYTQAVANVDRIFADLWAAIQADPEYRNSTTLILTNDHGRHDDAHGGFHQHGDGCDGCRHNFLLMVGPDTKKGAVLSQPASKIDLTPTVGELLGFQTPLADGRVLSESFISFRGVNRKEAKTAASREAVRLKQLSQRDLRRVVTGTALSSLDLASLPAAPDTVILFRGLLGNQAGISGSLDPATMILANRGLRDWLEKNRETRGPSSIYTMLATLEISPASGQLPDMASAFSGSEFSELNAVDLAFFVDLYAGLLARKGTKLSGIDIKQYLATLVIPSARTTGSHGDGHQDALVLYALSDTLLRLKSVSPDTVPWLPQLREICLLRYYQALQTQDEPGGLWNDPTDSDLYLAAAYRLQAAGLFRDFRPAKMLTAGKKQNERAAIPPLVAGLDPRVIRAWAAASPAGTPGSAAKAPRFQMSNLIWDRTQYLDYSRELTRFQVDENGRVLGSSSPLALGSFLLLWKEINRENKD